MKFNMPFSNTEAGTSFKTWRVITSETW